MTDYTIEKRDRRLQVTLHGDLTASIIPGLQAALRESLGTDVDELIFDLGKTAMLDSSGIGLLIASSNSITRRNGQVRVINVSPDILQLLQSMRLTGRLNVTGSAA